MVPRNQCRLKNLMMWIYLYTNKWISRVSMRIWFFVHEMPSLFLSALFFVHKMSPLFVSTLYFCCYVTIQLAQQKVSRRLTFQQVNYNLAISSNTKCNACSESFTNFIVISFKINKHLISL